MSDNPRIYLWDWATRLFHWLLVIAVAVSIYTGNDGGLDEMDWHMISGYSVLGLICFRVLWGFAGSHYARFSQFLRGPGPILEHSRQLLKRGHAHEPGHNPLGAFSVMVMLLLLAFQAGSGLFATDDILLEGPLVHLISMDTARQITGWHETNVYLIYGMLGLHVIAIGFYSLFHRQQLILPMVTGYRKGIEGKNAENRWILAIVLAAVSAAGVYLLVNYV